MDLKLFYTSGCSSRWMHIPVALSLMLGGAAAEAVEVALGPRYAIEQPSQDLADALRAIARLTNISVLFDPRAVAGRTSRPVSGTLSGVEAINAAIQGSGLEVHVTPDGAVVIKPASAPVSAPASSGVAVIRTSAAPMDTPDLSSAPGADDQPATRLANGRSVQEISRVEVTGSRLRRVETEGPAPVNVYTAKDIEKSGQPTLQLFLAGLTEVSMSQGEGASGRTLGQGVVQLRGLPLGSTLVLINGRKVEAVGSSTGSVFNLNLIPMAAIERVEVVPSGSSAVYGGDALAGVVNVILKKSLDGQSLMARLGTGSNFHDGSVSIATGGHSAEGRYMLMGVYSRSTPLTMKDRSFFQDVDFRRLGGTDMRLAYCTPGSAISVNGANLPGLTSSVAGIPNVGPDRTLQVSDFQATAGTRNLCNYYATGAGTTLIHGAETGGVHALGEHQLFGTWSAFAEVSHVRDRMYSDSNGISLNARVPATNLYNPFGVAVTVNTALGLDSGVTKGISRNLNFTRVLAGLKGEVAQDWDAEIVASTSQDRGGARTRNDTLNSQALAAALASRTAGTALNPFTTGRVATEEVLRGIWTDTNVRHSGRKDQLSGLLRGTLAQLWAGPVDAIVGAEVGRDWYDQTVVGLSELHGTRRSSATYAEVRVPLLQGGEDGERRWNMASLTVAARRDSYSDFGAASTFQGGLEVRPTRTLLIRGSAAGSFKPPTLLQTNVTESSDSADIYGLVDPARNNEPVTSGTIVRTVNRSLRPEEGQSRGLGFVWESEDAPGIRLSASYWQVRIRGLISVMSPQTTLNYESIFPGLVTRAPSVNGRAGVITSIKNTEVNFGLVDTSGIDVDAGYEWKTRLGRVSMGAGVTRTSVYRVVLAPDQATEDRLGRRYRDFWSPRLKGRLSAGLDVGSWNVGLTSRYLGAYKDLGTSDRRLGDFWSHDLAGSVNLKRLWPDVLPSFKSATFGISIANLTNREPQFAQGVPYFDVTQGDWRGRYVSARISLDW